MLILDDVEIQRPSCTESCLIWCTEQVYILVSNKRDQLRRVRPRCSQCNWQRQCWQPRNILKPSNSLPTPSGSSGIPQHLSISHYQLNKSPLDFNRYFEEAIRHLFHYLLALILKVGSINI